MQMRQGEIAVPSLTEATMADSTETLGLCPAPEYTFAYPAIRPLILFDKVLTNVGRVRVGGGLHFITHLICSGVPWITAQHCAANDAV